MVATSASTLRSPVASTSRCGEGSTQQNACLRDQIYNEMSAKSSKLRIGRPLIYGSACLLISYIAAYIYRSSRLCSWLSVD